MKIFNEREQSTEEINFSGTVEALLKQLDINPEAVIVVRNSEVIMTDENISNSDKIELLSVVSGG
jgi:thiamine biosynthesis protein ThiS